MTGRVAIGAVFLDLCFVGFRGMTWKEENVMY